MKLTIEGEWNENILRNGGPEKLAYQYLLDVFRNRSLLELVLHGDAGELRAELVLSAADIHMPDDIGSFSYSVELVATSAPVTFHKEKRRMPR